MSDKIVTGELAKQAAQEFLDGVFTNSSFEIVEASQKDIEAANRMGIVLPSKDIAVIRGTYLLADKTNQNKHRLSLDTVKKAVKTLIGKPSNISHQRGSPTGMFIDAEIDDNTKKFSSTSIFWKGLFDKAFTTISDWMAKGDAGQSFELRYNKSNYNEADDAIDLDDVEFCGGAYLPKGSAAEFDTSAVLLANVEKNLVFGGVSAETFECSCIECGHKMTSAKHCNTLKCSECGGQMRRADRPGTGQADKKPKTKVGWSGKGWAIKKDAPEDTFPLEVLISDKEQLKKLDKLKETIMSEEVKKATLSTYDVDLIQRLVGEVKCPACKAENGWFSILTIDFETLKVKAKCGDCEAIVNINLAPKATKAKAAKTELEIIDVKLIKKEDKAMEGKFTQEELDVKIKEKEVALKASFEEEKKVLFTQEQVDEKVKAGVDEALAKAKTKTDRIEEIKKISAEFEIAKDSDITDDKTFESVKQDATIAAKDAEIKALKGGEGEEGSEASAAISGGDTPATTAVRKSQEIQAVV